MPAAFASISMPRYATPQTNIDIHHAAHAGASARYAHGMRRYAAHKGALREQHASPVQRDELIARAVRYTYSTRQRDGL